MKPWIGVDFDGTLAHYTSWHEQGQTPGAPIEPMVARVKRWLAEGIDVRIFTARADEPAQTGIITCWLAKQGIPPLVVTNVKDKGLLELWDDRAVAVEKNTGKRLSPRVVEQ